MKKNLIKTNTYFIILVLLLINLTTHSFAQDGIINKEKPNNTYNVHNSSKSVNDSTHSNGYEDNAVSMQSEPLNIPTNITNTVASNLIKITWDSINNATSYEVKIIDSESNEVMRETGANTTYTHNGLEPASTYKYCIRAKNSDGYSPWSSEITATTTGNVYTLECEKDETYNIIIKAIDNTNFIGKVYTLTYDDAALEIDDLYIMSWERDKNIGEIPGTISFSVANPIESGKSWTGVLYGIRFKSKINGTINITLSVHS